MSSTTTHLPLNNLKTSVFLGVLLGFVISPMAHHPAYSQVSPNSVSEPVTIDDLYAEVGKRVPAFGGLFVDDANDTLYALMVPSLAGDAASLDTAITEVLGTGRPTEHHLKLIPCEYTFRQLKAWHDHLGPAMQTIHGTVFTDIDDGKNRLEIGVESLALSPGIEGELSALDIPRGAVNIVEVPPATTEGPPDETPGPLADIGPDGTLRDKFRPVVGGLQIEIAVKGLTPNSTCTLGFNAIRAKKPGIVTNDHCMKEHRQEYLKQNVVYQPTENNDNRIATGSVDPLFFKPEDNDKCLSTYSFCRFSDSAFAEADGNAGVSRGFIAKPQSGSQWDGMTKFRIVDLVKPAMDMAVTRVSSQTGIVQGKISNPCRNVEVTNKGRRTGDWLLCQVIVTWQTPGVPGDSGSPAFTTNSENTDVKLLGLVWGPTSVSPIDQIKLTGTELGPDLLVCAEGFQC